MAPSSTALGGLPLPVTQQRRGWSLVQRRRSLTSTSNPNPTTTPLFVYQPLVTTSAGDTSPGSLRQVVANAPTGTVITFAPTLAGQTITLGGELLVDASRAITLDASAVTGGVKLDGNNE